MATLTQGTELWMVTGATTKIKIGEITSINPPSPVADEIEVTDLDSTAKEFVRGLVDFGESQVGVNFDVAVSANHRQLLEDDGLTKWIGIGLSDGTTDIGAVTGSAFSAIPTTRSFISFQGFVKGFPLQFNFNDKATGTLTIRCSGSPNFDWKA